MKRFKDFLMEAPDNEYYHVTPTKNVKSILRNGLKPSVGARSAKLNEKPGTYLFKHKVDAHNAVMNWLGDEHEGTPLSLLKVSLPDHIKAHQTEAGYEHVVHDHIPGKHIKHEENLG